MSNPAASKKQLPAYLVLALIALVAALALALTNAITSGPIREREMKAQREAFGSVLMAQEYIAPEGFDPSAHSVENLVEARENGKTIGYCAVASANGYAGPVAVTLGVDAQGNVTGAKIGDGRFVETAGFGARWLDEGNWAQFEGLNAGEGGTIEALSGATVTSNAVLTAANNALAAVNAVMGKDRTEPVLAFGKPAEKPAAPQVTLSGDVKEGTARGFQSDVKVQLTLDDAGAISAIVIHSADETAGFGTRCTEDAAFAAQFIGKTAPLTLGEGVDALSGATVTSKAVVEAINAALTAPVSASGEAAAPEEAPAAVLSGDVKEGTARGFQSDVKVQLTLDDAGAISAIVIHSADETAGFGTRCAEDAAFAAQFIGKTAPVEVDVLSGATVTSKAVMEAANAALTPAEPTAPTAEETAEIAEKYDLAAPALTAAAPGFMGEDVGVSLTLNEDGTIATLTLDLTKQVPPVCDLCNSEDFLSRFIGKAGPFVKGENVDVLSGATFTSEGIINAVNAALPVAEPAAEATAEPTAPATITVPGYQGLDVVVTVTRDEAGAIAALTVNADTQSPGLGKKCAEEEFLSQFIGQTGPFALGENIDAISYATVTSQAIVDAINALNAQ